MRKMIILTLPFAEARLAQEEDAALLADSEEEDYLLTMPPKEAYDILKRHLIDETSADDLVSARGGVR
jgi:hypothetical protein